MRRSMNAFAVAILLAGFTSSVNADWPTANHKAHVDVARNNSWPQPFRGQDAYSVVAPFEIMKHNGWRDNNTIGSMMFGDAGLTDAGKLKVAQVLTTSPSNRRMIYVQAARTNEETASRVESVQVAVSELIPDGQLPQILVTNVGPTTSPGAYQTLVHRAIQRTTPVPRLPKYTGISTPGQAQMPQANQK